MEYSKPLMFIYFYLFTVFNFLNSNILLYTLKFEKCRQWTKYQHLIKFSNFYNIVILQKVYYKRVLINYNEYFYISTCEFFLSITTTQIIVAITLNSVLIYFYLLYNFFTTKSNTQYQYLIMISTYIIDNEFKLLLHKF